MEIAICYGLFSIVKMLWSRRESPFVRACLTLVQTHLSAWWTETVTKNRNGARRLRADHYPSATITRNPSADECPLAEPLIWVGAGRNARSRGRDGTDVRSDMSEPSAKPAQKSHVTVHFLFPASRRLCFRAALIPQGFLFFSRAEESRPDQVI